MAVDIIARGMAAKAQEKADSLGTGISFKGEVSSVSQLPVPSASTQGQLFYLTEAGTTTSDFVEGAGISIPAGTTIGIVEVNGQYKYDTFGQMIDLSTLATKDDVVAVRSIGGTATLLASAWNEGVLTLQIADLNTNDSIIFGAQTETDKAAISAADVLVSVSGQTVTFTANGTVPTADVNLNFNIIRGSVRSNAFVAGVKSGTFVMVNGSTVSIFNADTKANIDGFYEGLTVGLSENWTPYAEDSGTTQTQPFFLEGTATGNGESRVDAKQVPAFAFLQEKRGNMVTVNQLVQNGDFSNGMTGWTLAVGTSSISGGVCTITSTGGTTYMYQSVSQKVTGHKVLVLITAYASVPQSMNVNWGDLLFVKTLTTSPQIFSEIATVGSGNTNLNFTFSNAASGENIYVSNIRLVDLTQWFNGNIPAYLLSHPEAFGRYYKGSLAYEPGRLEPATGRYFESVGRNIWDEEWESGTIAASTGVKVSDANKIRSKNYISVTSGITYYVKAPSSVVIFQYDADKNYIGYIEGVANTTFTTDSTCHYIYFVCGSSVSPQTTYNHDITITEYYTGESGYDKYYPHKVLATIDTGTEQLGVFDYKVPSGLITRKTGSADLGTLKFYLNAGTYPSHSFYSRSVSDIKSDSTLLCADTTIISRGDYKLGLYTDGTAIIVVTKVNYNSEQELKDALSGIIAHYELATPTTEQGTPFQENVPIDDFGQLSWSDTNVPQGNQIFYPVDYKAAIDTLINYTDGDITGLAKRGSLTDTDPQTLKALVDYVNGKIPAAPTTDGTYDLVCTVTNGEPTFSWVART